MRTISRIFVKSAAVLLVGSISLLYGFVAFVVWHIDTKLDLPTYRELTAISTAKPICSSGGERVFVPLAAIASVVRNAVLAAEEPDFFDAPSFNIHIELARVVLFDLRPRKRVISSTVTNCLIHSKAGPRISAGDWHFSNAILLPRVEAALSKDTLFEIYLNETSFGRGTIGVGAAAIAYFGKSLSDLTLDEVAFIAGLPRDPSIIRRDKERGVTRRNFVLNRMLESGTITAEQARSATEQPLVVRPARN
jgi:membrane carboxypeptidase/penicillin-binding protein